MIRSYGQRRMTKPEGMLREIHFPELCLMDVATGDGRILDGAGAGCRELPLTIYAQFHNDPGHSGAVVAGALDYVQFDDDGVASGYGWLLDDDAGHNLIRYKKAGALRGNSVDLADVTVDYEYDFENDDLLVRFMKWNIAATTIVGKPAFANARYELLEDDDLVASWLAETQPLVMDLPFTFSVQINPALLEPEIVADASSKPAWELFYLPESPTPQKFWVGEPDERGYYPAFGHLGMWDRCHDGYDVCTIIPRPPDSYASFNQPGVITDKGPVSTGPIFFLGGHPDRPLGNRTAAEAYGGVENCWADVRVIEGKFGPWASGYVRPGTSETAILAARASRVSGHWKGDLLKAVVSVNAAGYDVTASYILDEEGMVAELIASFPPCVDGEPALAEETVTVTETTTVIEFEIDLNQLALELDLQDMDDEVD